jgi:hypothetical protein
MIPYAVARAPLGQFPQRPHSGSDYSDVGELAVTPRLYAVA